MEEKRLRIRVKTLEEQLRKLEEAFAMAREGLQKRKQAEEEALKKQQAARAQEEARKEEALKIEQAVRAEGEVPQRQQGARAEGEAPKRQHAETAAGERGTDVSASQGSSSKKRKITALDHIIDGSRVSGGETVALKLHELKPGSMIYPGLGTCRRLGRLRMLKL
jgi:hypothetical protein